MLGWSSTADDFLMKPSSLTISSSSKAASKIKRGIFMAVRLRFADAPRQQKNSRFSDDESRPSTQEPGVTTVMQTVHKACLSFLGKTLSVLARPDFISMSKDHGAHWILILHVPESYFSQVWASLTFYTGKSRERSMTFQTVRACRFLHNLAAPRHVH